MKLELKEAWKMGRERQNGFLDALLNNSIQRGDVLEIDGSAFKLICERWPKIARLRGLGDIAHLLARPVVMTADALFKTKLLDCQGCDERQQELNQKFPFSKP